MPLADRFLLGHELGRGAHGVVYEALPRDAQSVPPIPIALKRLYVPPVDGTAGALPSLRRHPHRVTLHNRFIADGAVWIAMDLVSGEDLVTYVRGDLAPTSPLGPHLPMAFGQSLRPLGSSVFAPCTPTGIARLRRSLGELGRALGDLHREGYVHRDIRPANVRVTPEGRTVLLDLDGVLPLDAAYDPGRETGPVAWVAPELGDGVPVAPAHDWYAVGVVLFEALTGDLPFAGNGADMVVRKQTVRAPSAGFLVRDIPADLDALCAGLLATAPGLRAGAREVCAVATG